MITRWVLGCLTGLSLLGLLVAGLTIHQLQPVPDDLSLVIKAKTKPQLLSRNGIPLTVTYQNQWNAHALIALHQIPDFLQKAFIYAEDQRFYQHHGVDWIARSKAIVDNVLALKKVRGASTISEQVVKMLHPRPRTAWSRWLEGWEAQQLEQRFDKATLLEFYLNQVPFAAQRRGVQQAANYYFDRDLDTLNQKEMLALAILVRAPSRFDLHKSSKTIESRLQTLLSRMSKAGLVNHQSEIKQLQLALAKPKPMLNIAHFANEVFRQDKSKKTQIRTTLDVNIQRAAQTLLHQRLLKLQSRKVANAAMLVADHTSGEILAWVVDSQSDTQSYNSVLVRRQPGSTLKPFVYAAAMEKGWTAATVIDDTDLKEAVGNGVHSYRNYSNTYHGKITLRNALGNSLNIPAIKATEFIGVDVLLNKLHQLGFDELDQFANIYGNGLALGNAEVSLLSLVTAYASLANKGIYRSLSITKNKQTDQQARSVVFSTEISSIIGHILSDPEARSLEFGRGGVLELPVQTAVKTGTSNDHRDAWVVGYNDQYVIGIWMGNLDSQPMQKITGSTGPALVLRSMFAELNRNRETRPLYFSQKLKSKMVCIELNLSECELRNEWFTDNQIIQSQAVTNNSLDRRYAKVNYQISYPVNNMAVARDPRIPDESESLQFRLNNNQNVKKVEWVLNDQLLKEADNAKYHWSLKTGEHSLLAKVYVADNSQPITTDIVKFTVK